MDYSTQQKLREYIRGLYDFCYFRLKARRLQYRNNQLDGGLHPSRRETMENWVRAGNLSLTHAENHFNEAAEEWHIPLTETRRKSDIIGDMVDRIDSTSLKNTMILAANLIEKSADEDLPVMEVDKLAYKFIEHINNNVTILFATEAPSITKQEGQVHYDMDDVPNPENWTP